MSLCSGVTESSVGWEPVMWGLFQELGSHWRSKPNQPIMLHALELKLSKSSFLFVFLLKCSIFQRNGEKEGVPYTPHTTMFPAAGTLPLDAPCPLFLGELVQCAQVPRQQAHEISSRDCIFTFSRQILCSSQGYATQGAKISPSCFYSVVRAALWHVHMQSCSTGSATFIKLCKSLLLSVASWTSTEYIFTARTRLWANFLHSVAKIYDIYVKETFVFCSLIAARNWGMWIKLSFIYSNRRQGQW